MRIKILLLLALTASAPFAAAEQLLSEQDFLDDIPRVFSASRLPQAPADTPGTVTVIDREMIRASGAREIAELFRLVPGFTVGYASGGRPVVAYHGLSGQYSQRMQVLLDGRSLYAPYLFGGVDWNNLPINLDDIERIEVLRGSNSAAYGANAFLGVANIITRTAAQSVGSYMQLNAGNSSVKDAAIRLGNSVGNNTGNDLGNVRWRLSAGHRQDDGLDGLFDNRNLTYLSIRTDLQINQTDEITLQAGVNANQLGTGFPRKAGDPERTEKTGSQFGLIRWQRSLAYDHEISLMYSRTSDDGTDRFTIPVTATNGLTIDYGRKAIRDHFEYQHFLGFGQDWRASWGAEIRSDKLTARQLFNTAAAQRSDSARAYMNAEWKPLPTWTFNMGGLVEKESISGTNFAPRLGANWKFSPEQTIRFGYSDAFRTPSLFEQRSDWRFVFEGQTVDIRYLSRGGLHPEHVKATEVSYLGDWRTLGLTIDARLYQERVSDLITQQLYSLPPGQEFDPSSGAYDLRNADSALLRGIEYQVRYRFSANQLWVLGQNFMRRTGSTAAIVDSIPRYNFHVLGLFKLPGERNASFAYYRNAPIRWLGEQATVEATRRLDLRLEQVMHLGDTRAAIALTGQALQGNYTDFRPGQSFTRTVWLSFSLEY